MSIPDPEQPVRSVAPPAYVGDWLPELVYAPARPIIREGRRELLYEVRRYPDGRQVLPVFSTLELLVAALGPAQPWAQAPLRAVRAVMAAAGVTEVELDPVVAEGAWRWNEADLARYQGGHAMSGQYTVVLDDLQGASDTFHREAQSFAAIIPTDGPLRPDGGSEAVNGMLQCVLEAIGGLHLAVAGTIGNHGDKLRTAHDNYQKCEVSVRELYDDLSNPSKITKLN